MCDGTVDYSTGHKLNVCLVAFTNMIIPISVVVSGDDFVCVCASVFFLEPAKYT